MATLDFEVVVYQVQLHRAFDMFSRSQGGTSFRSCGKIVCTGDQGETLGVYFVDQGSPVPDNWFDPQQKWGRSFVPAGQYAWYLDLLRNEGPVYAMLDSDRPALNGIRTALEAVGDGEL